MLKLGHITYSNCLPVHGRFLERGPPADVALVHGIPGALNKRLASGELDVAPASSIEFARHADRYRILPDLSIAAPGPVRTVQLVGPEPLEELRDGTPVALPTASATSVVLVKIIMRQRLGIQPSYRWFDQDSDDPFAEGGRAAPGAGRAGGAQAALYIGDAAYHQRAPENLHQYDLGALWREWTGTPFVFALWQTSAGPEMDGQLRALAAELTASRDWSMERLTELAERHSGDYGWPCGELVAYWQSLEYAWDESLAHGLAEFYRRAAEIGEIPNAPSPVFLEV